MSSPVSITDVARAAGVSKTTVSRVINGKLDKFRIGLATQARVRAVARQLGYQPNAIARDVALGKFHPAESKGGIAMPFHGIPDAESRISEVMPKAKQIGVVLSTDSSVTTLGLIPGIESVLEAADYWLVIMVVPAEPTIIRDRVTRLRGDGIAGILCCPNLYPTIAATGGGTCPIIVLWQGAGKAMLAKLAGSTEPVSPPLMEDAALSAPDSSTTTSEPVPVEPAPDPALVDTAVTEHRPPLNPVAEPPNEGTSPAVSEPVSPPPMEGAAPSAPASSPNIPEPVPVEPAPDPASVDTAVTEPRPPLNPVVETPFVAINPVEAEPPPQAPTPAFEPVTIPEPAIEPVAEVPDVPTPVPVPDPPPVAPAVTESYPPLNSEAEPPEVETETDSTREPVTER